MEHLYHMKMVFNIDVSITSLNKMLSLFQTVPVCHERDRMIAKNAFQIEIEQTMSCVPTKDILDQYADSIKKEKTIGEFTIENVTFAHYKFFEEITVSEENIDEKQNQ